MRDVLADSAADLLALLTYAAASAALAGAGVFVETAGVRDLLSGETMLGAWLAFVGLVALAAAAHLARDQVVPRAAALR